ncbi:murein hydrolase activator EnvC family protein [Gottfriedia acidiceleris]|uniref:Peptidoglycan DD-metalloendopeptidase family protein n=1 Tax=Gottfriedia acidiceleris TaxID=371036 RepID=A0ABY4JR94_9BACI|nr:M23 family metallopeptidase [Gottfriedia acidiceleris]UPM56353.1 peptidoglycan DD-metalloendopeptidase family protein [Gottfriedia acidiceleris]
MKRIISKIILVAASLSFTILPNDVLAENIENTKIKSIQDKRVKVQEEAQKAKNEMNQLNDQKKLLLNSLNTINKSIENAKIKKSQKVAELINGKKEIEKLQVELEGLQKSVGNNSYIDVIFDAKSIGDLVQRINAIGKFMNADKDLVKEQKNDIEKVELKKKDLILTQFKLKNDKKDLQNLERSLVNQETQMNAILSKLKDDLFEKEQDILSLEEQEELLKEQEKAIKVASSISGGNFTRPAEGYLSSGFGYRSFDHETHFGVDIVKKGSTPIVSVANGVVIRAYNSASYGNVVFITHNINGKVFTSVYAHMQNYQVSAGQSVSKGQKIGTMGNTGHSFGKHLHFELHDGQWNEAKSNAVNPAKYINF